MRAAVFLLPVLCFAASNPSLDGLIDRAHGLPGEFAADALIRLASLKDVPAARRIQLLQDAFHRAGEAQEPLKRRAGVARLAGAAAYMNRAYAQDLDGMSLRMRAIEAVMPLDPAKARALFQDVPTLHVPAVPCTEFLTYDVSRYYAVLGRLGAREPLKMVEPRIQEITSPVQVEPAARMILALHTGNEDFRALVAALGGVVRRISGDDRSFAPTVVATGPAILDLVEESRARGIPADTLTQAYRMYLVANYAGPRCADTSLPDTPLQFFNEHLAADPVQPIGDSEAAPTKKDAAADGLRTCQEADCRNLTDQMRGLMMNAGNRAYSDSEKASPEWQEKLRQYLAAVENWKGDSTTGAQVYREKSGLYSDLLAITPPGRMQETVVQATLDFVRAGEYQARNRMEWFLPANVLIGRMELEPLGLGKLAPRVRTANDPVVSFYLDLESIAPRGPQPVMALL